LSMSGAENRVFLVARAEKENDVKKGKSGGTAEINLSEREKMGTSQKKF